MVVSETIVADSAVVGLSIDCYYVRGSWPYRVDSQVAGPRKRVLLAKTRGQRLSSAGGEGEGKSGQSITGLYGLCLSGCLPGLLLCGFIMAK